jgi:hypothetical protein
MINTGSPSSTVIDLAIPNFGTSEIIRSTFTECIIPFVSSDGATDLQANLQDITNNLNIADFGNLNPVGQVPNIAGVVISPGGLNVMINIHNNTPPSLRLRFTSGNLAKLTAGSFNFYWETLFLPAP